VKDSITAKEFIRHIDALTSSDAWSELVAYNCIAYTLWGWAQEWLDLIMLVNKYKEADLTWMRYKTLFKAEFATQSDDKLIIEALSNLSMKTTLNPPAISHQGHKDHPDANG